MRYGLPSPAIRVRGAVIWRQGCFIKPVKSHVVRRVFIPKNETEFRPLGIPAVRDRVAQEGVRRLWNPIFEPLFHPASFGFRPNRNCHMALEAVLELHAEELSR